ncbi:MAG: caspase family protein [Myxococcota bacterium]
MKRALFLAVLGAGLWVAGCTHARGAGEKGGLVTVSASASEVAQAFEGRRFALVVGINEAGDERWRQLRFAQKDATDLGAVLADPTHGAYADVTVLTRREETTTQALRAAVKALAAKATKPDDIIVLYLSAHGTLAHDTRGQLQRYLVTSDAEFHRAAETALAVDEVLKLVNASASRRRVVVLATCHSGGGKSALPDAVAAELASLKGPSLLRPLEESSRASIVLSASDWSEQAREDEGLQNDVYTHFLIEALTGAGDRNGDGAVSATEAHDFARRRTWDFSNGRQRPSAELVEVGADPVILSGRVSKAGSPELYSYAARLDGFTLKVDGEARGELPGGVAVRPGAHAVELTKGGDVLVREEVSLEVGERLDVEELLARREPWVSVAVLGGVYGFLDAASRAQLLPAAPSVGATVRFDRVGFRHLSVEVDVSGWGGSQTVEPTPGAAPVPFQYGSVLGGVSVLFRWDPRIFSLWVGPRVAGLWVQRSFSLEAYAGNQSAFSVTPGLLAGAAVRLGQHWEVSMNGQLMMTVLSVDGATRVLGFAGGWAAVGYRF